MGFAFSSLVAGLAMAYRHQRGTLDLWKFILIDFTLFALCYQFGSAPAYWFGYAIGRSILEILDALARPDSESALPSLESDDAKPLEDAPDRNVFQELLHANDPDYPCGETQRAPEKDS